MKHLEAGLIVGAIALAALAATTIIWVGIAAFAGPMMATGVIGLTLIIGIGATIIDYLTEKR